MILFFKLFCKNSVLRLSALLLLLLSLTGCGPKIYKSAAFDAALTRHKIVAILPADVSTSLRPNEAKKITPVQLKEMNEKTGFAIQDKMYSWFLRRAEQYDYTVSFQDIIKTNGMLKEAGISYTDLITKDRKELATLLGVDAIIQNKSLLERPMSDGTAIVIGVLFGILGSTNNVHTTINIHDGNSGSLLWKYDYQAAGALGSSSTNLVNELMRKASKKFPYTSLKL